MLNDSKIPISFGLLRLSEMINFSVMSVAHLLAGVAKEELLLKLMVKEYPQESFNPIDDVTLSRIKRLLEIAKSVTDEFEWEHVDNRIKWFN